ncbi:CCGSCS motif protein [Colwellia demingiae]|uniref:CCGSCS motif protein n=1 Tax=Colwellia demingiae TaxID=89401 RepID=A0A5C6QTJ2_9GAMM|nr:CCGSCS motif protein [Colwellia demingiae]TWX72032.1 CCGSCS motif protein [Colwellia demingiae]
MFNIFKTNKEQTNDDVSAQSNELESAVKNNSNEEGENKKVHGEDGVCCGGCGGE